MDDIEAPKRDGDYPDRELDLQQALDAHVVQLIDDAAATGWGTLETIDALAEVIRNRRLAYLEDPDPRNDDVPITDPANDWPAAT